jgi:hypothetical protein
MYIMPQPGVKRERKQFDIFATFIFAFLMLSLIFLFVDWYTSNFKITEIDRIDNVIYCMDNENEE